MKASVNEGFFPIEVLKKRNYVIEVCFVNKKAYLLMPSLLIDPFETLLKNY